jgi:AsmA protein
LVQADLDFDRLQVGSASAPSQTAPEAAARAPWSDREIDLDVLKLFDAEIRLSAAEVDLQTFRIAPISVETKLSQGVVKAQFTQAGLYEGEANGTVSLDLTGPSPIEAMRVRLERVNALPLLSDWAMYSFIEGQMQADIDVTASGASQRAVLSTLSGPVEVELSNGAVRGIDLAKLLRELMNTILNGWQQDARDRTPVDRLGVLFQIANGIASTDNLRVSGPVMRVTGAGAIDLPGRTLKFRVDPRLVADARASGEGGLGVPVMIEGDWSEPRIYPDIAGILDNPEAAFAQLDTLIKEMGNFFNNPGGAR